PLYFLTRDYLSTSAAALLMVFIMLPGFLLAMYERHGQPLEVVVMQMIQCCFLRPKERPYQTNNAYAALMRQHQMEQEVKAIVQKRNPKRNRKNKADPRPAKRN
ncbi:PrgI family protein, partial [Bariatricus sp. SGI.161]|uniref:PrgI family protein n=1 Tax=Bariatricus sp. SGI.161 TaxID=3420550 RepID=UPI003D04F4F4